MLYPLTFHPLYYAKVWGGRRLASLLERALPPDEPIGESWEIADHPHGMSVVADGPLQGLTLHEVIARDPAGVLGRRVAARGGAHFPLLVKLLDAEDKLSVQVHPNDAYAAVHAGDLGKTEMWYVLHAKPGATLIAGLQPGVTPDAFRAALAAGDPAALLYELPVQAGDCLFIPAGRVHAILPGLVILEIQQNSDTTYRLYDWGRVGLDGQPRALHVEEAIAVTDWTDCAPAAQPLAPLSDGPNCRTPLARCDYFVVDKYDLAGPLSLAGDGESFTLLNCVAGSADLTWAGGTRTLVRGASVLVPAALAHCQVLPHATAALVVTRVP